MTGRSSKNSSNLKEVIRRATERLRGSNLLRRPYLVEGRDGKYLTIGRRRVVSFAGNDYLGLSQSEIPSSSILDVVKKYGWGASSSRLIQGNSRLHEKAEMEFARFKGHESCVLFNSAFAANAGVLQALSGPDSTFFSDEFNHASIIDGLRIAKSNGSKVVIYRHCDPDNLAAKIAVSDTQNNYIVTEALFSVDGDTAPIPEIEVIAEKYGATRIYDETHSTGMYGKNGAGLLALHGVSGDDFICVSNISKAGGFTGGFVTSNEDIKTWLLSGARSLIYTTALPPFVCSVAVEMIKLLERAASQRKRLMDNIAQARRLFSELKCDSPIISRIVGGEQDAMNLQAFLLDNGFFAPALRPPTVPAGTSRLRISLSSLHAAEDIQRLHELITSYERHKAR